MNENKKQLRVMIVCLFGIGTSLILKIGVDEVLSNHKIKSETFCSDADTALGQDFDLVLTSQPLLDLFKDVKQPVLVIENFFNETEIIEKLLPIIQNLSSAQD